MESRNQTSPTAFAHGKLRRGYIRLLRLREALMGKMLTFDLFNVCLAEKPQYFALSYVWGSPVRNSYALCNGKELMVTQSVVEALEGLRKKLLDEDLPVWIDAVCINQLDKEERGDQVLDMHRIYRGAAAVLVWLGPEYDDSDLAMAAINRFGEDLAPKPGFIEPTDLAEHGLPPQHDPAWKALGLLYSRAWFFRVWTYQEIVLAAEARVLCGAREVSWHNVEHMAYAMQKKRLWPYTMSEKTQDTLFRGFQSAVHIAIARADIRSMKSRKSYMAIGQLLDVSRKRTCSDRRDRVYAILSLAEQQFREQIPVDYDTSVASLYIQCGKVALKQDLSYLRLVSVQDPTVGLPSWCLDPSSVPNHLVYAPNHLRAGILVNGNAANVHIELDSDAIAIEGFRADVVDEVVPMDFVWHHHSTPAHAMNVVKWEIKCRLLACKTLGYPCTDAPIEHICVISGYTKPELDDWKGPITQAYKDQMRHLASLAYQGSNCFPPAERMPLFETYWEETFRICPGRSYFSTRNGKCGIGSPATKKGDLIAIFYGAGPAFVLRERDQAQMQFIGDAFVHGFMDLKDTRKEDIGAKEWFVIS